MIINDLMAMAQTDTYASQTGRCHLLVPIACSEILDNPNSSLAQLMRHGEVAKLASYPLVVALLAAESYDLRRLPFPYLIFAHNPLYLPCIENTLRSRRLAVGLVRERNGLARVNVTRIKVARPLIGNASIAFGPPILKPVTVAHSE